MKLCSRTLLTFLIALTCLSGCKSGTEPGANSRVTKSNLRKIVPDMSLEDVEAILGTGETVRSGFANVNHQKVPAEERIWSNGQSVITVSFVKGKVAYASGVNL